MCKRNIGYPIIFFVCFTVYQLVFNDNVEWFKNIVLAIIVFLFYIFWAWVSVPYDWSKKGIQNSDDIIQ